MEVQLFTCMDMHPSLCWPRPANVAGPPGVTRINAVDQRIGDIALAYSVLMMNWGSLVFVWQHWVGLVGFFTTAMI